MKSIFEIDEMADSVGGLYVHLLQPTRRMMEPGKVIEAGMSVVKPGKFTRKLSERMKQYDTPKYWHYEDGTAAFINATTRSYLIFDATNLIEEDRWLITGLEDKLSQLISHHFTVVAKIGKSKSEYRQIEWKGFEYYDTKMNEISEQINQLANDILLVIKKKNY